MAYADGCIAIPLTGAVAHVGGEVCSVANPEGVPLIITDVKLYVTHVSDAAAHLHVGIGAAAATHESNNLMDNLDIVASTVGGYHGMTALAANGAAQVWGTTQFLTVTGSASSVGFTGTLFVKYIRAA
jgi:hypothetical protein